MKYKLDDGLRKIESPVHITEPFEMAFDNGNALCDYDFDKYYLVKSIKAAGREIEIVLKENTHLNDIGGTEEVSFF